MKHVAVGIILRDGLVLACQRPAEGKYPLKWEFPGGKVESGESYEHALIRELREELGIEAKVDRLFHVQEWVYHDSVSQGNSTGEFHVRYFIVRHFTGEPVNHAFAQIRWMTINEFARMDNLEGNRPAIDKLISDPSIVSANESEAA